MDNEEILIAEAVEDMLVENPYEDEEYEFEEYEFDWDLVEEEDDWFQYQVGDFVENCSGHPAIVTEADGDEILALDLVTGGIGSHSARYCLNGAFIPRNEINDYLRGDKGYYSGYMIFTFEEFLKEYRANPHAWQEYTDAELQKYYEEFKDSEEYKFFKRNRVE